MKKVIATMSFFALCLPVICLAHPGHGNTGGYTITHYFTEPVHLVTMLITLTTAYFYNRYQVKNEKQKENN